MNVDIKREWVAALRSGKYEQCKGAICDDKVGDRPRYCCLGVLAWHVIKSRDDRWRPRSEKESGLLKREERVIAGLTLCDQREVAIRNDGFSNFAQIADWIEANI